MWVGQKKSQFRQQEIFWWINNRFRRVRKEQAENLVTSTTTELPENVIQKYLDLETYLVLFFFYVCTHTHTGLFFWRQDLEQYTRESKNLWYNNSGVNRTGIGALGLENKSVRAESQLAQKNLSIPSSLQLICVESEGWASVSTWSMLAISKAVSCAETENPGENREYACSLRLSPHDSTYQIMMADHLCGRHCALHPSSHLTSQ